MADTLTGFFGGYSDQTSNQFQNKLMEMQAKSVGAQAQGINLDNASKTIGLHQDLMMQKLTQDRMQRMQQAGKVPDSGQPSLQDMSAGAVSTMMDTAGDLIAAGKWKAGMDMEAKASTMLRQQSLIQRDQSLIAKDKLIAAMKEAELVGRLANGVTDERGWQQVKMQFQALSGSPLPKELENLPYSPRLIEALKNASMTTYQNASLKLKKLDTDSKINNRANAIKNRDKFNDLDAIKAKARAQAEGRLEAAGGGSVAPKAADLAPFIKAIQDKYPELDLVEVPIIARDLLDRTNAIIKSRPAVTKSEAMEQAYQAQKKDGMYVSEQIKTGGGSPQYAIPLKQGVKPEDGKWYTDGKSVKQYNKGGIFSSPSWSNDLTINQSDDLGDDADVEIVDED